MMVTDKMSYRPIGPIVPILPILPILTGIIFNTRAVGGGVEGACLAVRGALFHGGASLDMVDRVDEARVS